MDNLITKFLVDLDEETEKAEEKWLLQLDSCDELEIRLAIDPISGQSLLHLAVEYRFAKAVKRLVELGVDVNVKDYNGTTPFLLSLDSAVDNAAQAGIEIIDFSISKLLVDLGADVNVRNNDELDRESILRAYGSGATTQYDHQVIDSKN